MMALSETSGEIVLDLPATMYESVPAR